MTNRFAASQAVADTPSGRCRASEIAGYTVELSDDPGEAALARWDALVGAAPLADVSQLSSWARLRATVGFTPRYVLVSRGGVLVAGAQLLVRRLPPAGAVGYLPYGPVLAAGAAPRAAVCRVLGAALAAIGREQVSMLFVQPPDGAGEISAELLWRGFRPSSAGIAPPGSLRLDLTVPEDDLLRGLSKRLRTWTRQWPARGVRVRQGDERDVGLLVDLVGRSARHQGYRPLAEGYVREMYRRLAPGGHVALFVGEVDGTPVAAELDTVCGATLRQRLGGLDRSGPAAQLSVPAAVTWEAVRWARARGLTWFDFGGLRDETLRALLDGGQPGAAPRPVPRPGVDQFKIAFGGSPFRYPIAVELIRSPVLRLGYDLARHTPPGRRLLAGATRLARGARG